MTEHALRLADLLAEERLGLRLLTDADPDTPVHGAHAIEIEHPARWVKPGWLVLTTGNRFDGPGSGAAQQRELVRELVAAGMAGLAFGVGLSWQAVPPPLLDEAHRQGFALLSVPLETPFLEVIDVVRQATLTNDAYLQRRTVHVQDYLLESLAEQDAAAALVHRLADLLRGTVVLYDRGGTVIASSGLGPTQLIRGELAASSGHRKQFTVGRWHIHADPIRTGDVLHWLAIATRRRSVSEDLAEPAMEAARRLVSMIVRSRESVRTEDRLRRAELLRMVAAGNPSETGYLWDRLDLHGFRRGERVRLLLLADTACGDSPPAAERAARFEQVALDTELRLLAGAHEGRVLGLVPADEPPLRRWCEQFTDTVHCGLSEPFRELTLGPTRLREAELALASALRGGQRAVPFERIGLVDWLIAGRDADSVQSKAAERLAPITEHPPLLEALRTYLRCDCDIQRTARKLGLHPNSIRYRLKRAGALTGLDLRSPADLAELSLSVRLLGE